MHSQILTILASAALAAAQTNTNLQTTFPTPSGTTHLAAVKTIAAGQSHDGGMKQWDRNPSTCNDQSEGGEKDAVFILQDGATLSNVIIGPNNGEGVHCKGRCTLNNVWWTDVCEDAATFRGTTGTSYVNGGGAREASDKVFQHNGNGLVAVKNFYAKNIGKLYRSCGNCGTQYARHSTFTNIKIEGSSQVVAGVNANYGDSTQVKDSCILKGAACWIYQGNSNGKEPTKIASGPSGTACVASAVKTAGC
ncbi:family 3 putative polysaccharide lyase [Podospora australis]|uniref:Pectate lyase n=1 Tax=Podospora australis TaxID=1536484 RepID=A0AAN6WHX9_9PEZI|nr:family 3 putative polysaccharide lyase [Podospora australis]